MQRLKWLAVTLILLAAMVAGGVRGYAQCGSYYGNGDGTWCNWGSSCIDYQGVPYGFCVVVGCTTHSLNCAPPWYFLQSECYVMGCWGNYFLNACGLCSNGGR